MGQKTTDRNQEHLGAYLARSFSGKTDIIARALEIQAELDKQGLYKPLGRIIVEQGEIDSTDLDAVLRVLWEDILLRVDLFEALSPEALRELTAAARSMIVPAGEIVCRSHDKGDNYYVVASGAVRVFKENGGTSAVTFDVLGPGDGFGEIALLTNEQRSAAVETTERTCLICIPREAFIKVVFSNSAAAKTCARILAERLARSNVHIADASSAGTAYRQFIAEQQKREVPMLIGNSAIVMKLLTDIERVAGNVQPVLVHGEPGTELLDAAGLIHMMGKDSAGLFMGMNAKTAGFPEAQEVNVDDPITVELIQAGTLFGRGYNALPFAPDKRMGLIFMARNGMVVIENIERLAMRVQEQLADYLERSWFHAVGEKDLVPSNARIIATSSADLAALTADGVFDRRLNDLLASQSLAVPPLRKRKKDIPMIVNELIKRNNRKIDKNVKEIDDEAYKAVMGYNWPGNTEELSVVMRRAVSIARGDRLTLEDIFIGPPPVTGKFTVNLLKYGPIKNLFVSTFYPRAGILVTAPFIALLVGLGLFGVQDPDRNIALILTWGLWEPMLIISAFFVTRMWCGVCPVGALSQLVRRTVGHHLKVPVFLRNYGLHLSALGIAVIIAAESAAGMLQSPRATALLVLSIAALAALSGFLFQRSTWCRYLCPLGSIVGTLANCSILELRSNYGICNSACLKHECYTGDERHEGCPMFEGPFFLMSNRNCVLCGTCVKICSNDSPVLNLRLPGYDLWTVRTPDKSIAVVGIALMGTQLFRGMERIGWLHGAMVDTWAGALSFMALSVLVSAIFARVAAKSFFEQAGPETEGQWYRSVYILLPLVFAFEAGYHLERLLTLGGQLFAVLGRQAGLGVELPGISASSTFIRTFQTFLVLVAAAGSTGVLAKLRRVRAGGKKQLGKHSVPVLMLAAAYLWMFLARQ